MSLSRSWCSQKHKIPMQNLCLSLLCCWCWRAASDLHNTDLWSRHNYDTDLKVKASQYHEHFNVTRDRIIDKYIYTLAEMFLKRTVSDMITCSQKSYKLHFTERRLMQEEPLVFQSWRWRHRPVTVTVLFFNNCSSLRVSAWIWMTRCSWGVAAVKVACLTSIVYSV